MKIHEYQAKELFKKYNIPVPEGRTGASPDQCLEAARELNAFPVVLKAQIHAGGRGKGGGVKLASSFEEVEDFAQNMLGSRLVTPQTGAQGSVVNKVLVEQGTAIRDELYLSLLPDRNNSKIVIMASMAGGMDIEEVAEKYPEKLIKVQVSPLLGLQAYHVRKVIFGLDLPQAVRKEFNALLNNLYRLFIEYDCSLLEINPLVISEQDQLLAIDAKLNFDDNALYRHQDILECRDLAEEDPVEIKASEYNLNYIKMDGNVGNLVNGAGLAMATMDIIKRAGAEPANFLDVGGGASAEMVENGFRIILEDEKVKAILINIFGGILRCDVLAKGVIEAAQKVGIKVPVVVRMEGTNVQEGRKLLAESGLDLRTSKNIAEAAAQIAEIVKA